MNIESFILFSFLQGLLFLGIGIWEEIIIFQIPINKLNNSNFQVYCFITFSFIKNLINGIYALFVSCGIINTRKAYLKIFDDVNEIPIFNFGIMIWCIMLYFGNYTEIYNFQNILFCECLSYILFLTIFLSKIKIYKY